MMLRKIRRRFRAWGRRQLYSFFSSLGALLSHRLGTLMTVLVLGIAMALPLGLYVTLNNLSSFDLKQEDWGAITVFLAQEAGKEQALAFTEQINDRNDASAVSVSPAQGMEEFRDSSGFGQAIDVFEENPLPWVIMVTPISHAGGVLSDQVSHLESWLVQQEHVDMVQVDHKWMQRLSGLLDVVEAFITVLTLVFSLAVVVVVANTIRLDVANRADEIQVLSLVGAGNGFIRQPFLYSGFWYGMMGALFALILLAISVFYLQSPVQHLLHAYGNSFQLKGLTGKEVLWVLFTGGLLGFLGAWLSVQHYLRALRDGGQLVRI